VSARIYIEGGGDSKELHTRCREGFRRLLQRCGFKGCMPRLVACGGRGATFGDFSTAHANAGTGEYVAMLVDSEDPVADVERTWDHLNARDRWERPGGAVDEQVLLMTTCMETWLTADRDALRVHFADCLQENALPSLTNLESCSRDDVQNALVRATRTGKAGYAKGKRSFEIVGRLDPATLRQHLPSFARCERVLKTRLRRRT
jgi:hypothetical protein